MTQCLVALCAAKKDHSVACHPTQVNALASTPVQQSAVLDLPISKGWKAKLILWLVRPIGLYRNDLLV